MPWDWSNLISLSSNDLIEFNAENLISKVDRNTIEFANIKFKIGSVVYQNASSDDIINGFKELNTLFDFIRVIEVLLKTTVISLKSSPDLCKFEPQIADFIKICYWYNNLKNISTVEHRRKELRSRLCKGLLYNLEKGKVTIDVSNLTDEEIKSRVNSALEIIRNTRLQEKSRKILRTLNTYLDYINVCISELMFPALANELNFDVDFTPANNPYDFDMIIDGHSTQIKTLFSYQQFPIDEIEKRKQEIYLKRSVELRDMYEKKMITWEYVAEEVLEYIKTKCFTKINDTLRQKAEIIILDGTRTIPGLLLNYHYTDDSEFVKIHDSFEKAMNNIAAGFTNIIFASTAYDTNFRISTLVIRVPVEKVNQINDSAKDKITII
ncbi:MAG: hypothetical protein GEU26_18665 [Nitrososphaeraceae archaeon]|nr:hypothetical protein [Nitrososphaeraceae archaeon]